MGSSRDLNSLKSWNPKLSRNKESVKRLQHQIVEREKELEKEAKKREVDDLASIKKDSLSWMYETPPQDPPKNKTQLQKVKNTQPTANTKTRPKSTKKKIDYSKDDPMAKLKR